MGSFAFLQEPPAQGHGSEDWDAVAVVAVGPEELALLIVTETASPLTVACRTYGLPVRSCRTLGVLTYTPEFSRTAFLSKPTVIKV